MVNVRLIRGIAGCILIDSGILGSEKKIARVLARNGLSFRDNELIILTHAHTGPARSASRLRQLWSAPILVHQDDEDFFSRKEPMTFCPTCLVGQFFLKKTQLPHQPYEGFVPDIMIKNGVSVNLSHFGVDGWCAIRPNILGAR
jgi:hydroxyacylglutathione hydrolase